MDSALLWLALAVALFWSVGAYNRLVRLRSLAIAAFQVLDARLGNYIVLVDTHITASATINTLAQQPFHPATSTPVWAGLLGARTQFEASLRVVRRRALDAGAMAALQTAHGTLQAAWARVLAHDRDQAELLPASCGAQWDDNSRLVSHAMAEFNRAVLDHNAAITQFPALLLARIFGFRPAGCL